MSEHSDNTSRAHSRGSERSSPEEPDPKAGSRGKAGIRVSLACVQCRSKHVKCDATLPACMRCRLEDKPCYYAKSRRGIRDPKKRSLISDKPPMEPTCDTFFQMPPVPAIAVQPPFVNSVPAWNISAKHMAATPATDGDVLVNMYFTYFHPSHPSLPPKRVFLEKVRQEPDTYQFLVSVVRYVGSLYAPHLPSEDLRESAYAAACGPLPMTAHSVQGLCILGVAAMGEAKLEYQAGWTNRAISIALEIGMHHQAFADSYPEPVMAESYRRTFWSLYLYDILRRSRGCVDGSPLYDVAITVDLPCEEWEYDSEQIPQPMSLAQFDIQDSLGSTEFSSFAYLVDLCRICATCVIPWHGAEEEQKPGLFDRADSRLCDWLIRLPKWKMELVDGDGVVDLVLFQAIALAHVQRLNLRRHHASRHIRLNIRQVFPLGPPAGPHRQGQTLKGFGWNAIPIDIQAANSICDLFRYSLPIKNLSPLFTPALLRTALAYLDACVFLGLNTPGIRERLTMVLRILVVHGETWPLSRKMANEIKMVVMEYISIPSSPSKGLNNVHTESWTANSCAGVLQDSPFPDFDFSLNNMEEDALPEWPALNLQDGIDV